MYDTWESLQEACLSCQKCGLRQGCRQVVFGIGNPESKVLFIGEGPGEQEDIQGEFKHGVLKLRIPKKEAAPQVEENKYITIE